MDVQAYIEYFKEKIPKPLLYEEWKGIRDTMIVHTRGVKPTKLLEVKRPNEDPDLKKYRIATYRPITKDKINHAIDSVISVTVNSNYSIKYSSNIAEPIQQARFKLQDDTIFEPLPLFNLITEHVSRFVFDDPNGLLVWLPVHPIDNTLPPSQAEQTEKVSIQPMLVDSHKICDMGEDYAVWEGKNLWTYDEPTGNGTTKKKNPYYFILTKEVIYRMLPYWDKSENKVKYKEELWYDMGYESDVPERNLPFATFKVLGGNVTMNPDNQKFFESFFQSYAAFGDEAICAFSDNQAVRVRFNFPFVAVKSDLCPTCKGSKKVPDPDHKGANMTCNTCKGLGSVVPFSPFGTFYKKPPATNDNEAYTISDFIEFRNPDVAILKESFLSWQVFIDLAAESINLVFTKEAQSGVAKEIDRQEKTDMLFKILGNMFDIVKFSIDSYECYYVPSDDERKLNDNVVTPPTNLAIKSQDDLFAEMNDLIAKEAPSPFISTTAIMLSQKIYNGNREVQKIIEVLTIWDVLFGKTDEQIGQLNAMGAIGDREKFIHVNGYAILYKLAQEKDLEDMEVEEIITEADKKVVLPERTPIVADDGTIDDNE